MGSQGTQLLEVCTLGGRRSTDGGCLDVYRHSKGLPTSSCKVTKVQQDKGLPWCKSLAAKIGSGGYEQQAVFIGDPHRDL